LYDAGRTNEKAYVEKTIFFSIIKNNPKHRFVTKNYEFFVNKQKVHQSKSAHQKNTDFSRRQTNLCKMNIVNLYPTHILLCVL